MAGSERANDTKNHTKERIEESKAINTSLMTLKECIRARTMVGLGMGLGGSRSTGSSTGSGSTIHNPYRRSKLTLLMKDIFDIKCSRLCSTVVIGHVSPLAVSISHSINTIQYIAPLRLVLPNHSANGVNGMVVDPLDPSLWQCRQVQEWVTGTIYTYLVDKYQYQGQHHQQNHATIDNTENIENQPSEESQDELKQIQLHQVLCQVLVPSDTSGLIFCNLSEIELIRRILLVKDKDNTLLKDGCFIETLLKSETKSCNQTSTEILISIATYVYSTLWTLVCDAKTRRRRPNGTIITREEELAGAARIEKDADDKSKLWLDRENQLKSSFA